MFSTNSLRRANFIETSKVNGQKLGQGCEIARWNLETCHKEYPQSAEYVDC